MTTLEKPTLATVAQEFRSHLEYITKPGSPDEKIVHRKNDAPDWVQDVCQAAHHAMGQLMFPDDYRYDLIDTFASCIEDFDFDAADDPDEQLDHVRDSDSAAEWVDSSVSVYSSDRVQWLASHALRRNYVDEARENMGGGEDLDQEIGMGMYEEGREVLELLLTALKEILEDRLDEYCDAVAAAEDS